MNATFDRLALVSTRTWWRVTITTGIVNVANFAMDLTFGHPYSATVGIPVSLVATGTSIASTAMRAKRRRLDEHERLAIEAEQEAKAELERKWRADVYRVAFPDPGPDQCPVCGLDDLAFFVQADAFTGDTGGPMARVVAYGPVFAHRECAQIVPYDKYYAKTPECRHRLGYHHAYPEGAVTAPIRCAACDRERDTGVKDAYPAPDDCVCNTCQGSRRDAQRETATPAPHAVRPRDRIRLHAAAPRDQGRAGAETGPDAVAVRRREVRRSRVARSRVGGDPPDTGDLMRPWGTWGYPPSPGGWHNCPRYLAWLPMGLRYGWMYRGWRCTRPGCLRSWTWDGECQKHVAQTYGRDD